MIEKQKNSEIIPQNYASSRETNNNHTNSIYGTQLL